MKTAQAPIERLQASFPESFDFYHLGRIDTADTTGAAQPTAREILDELMDPHCAAFVLSGAGEKAYLLLFFDGHLDSSVYAEAGNILASRMAGKDWTLSPPSLPGAAGSLRLLESLIGAGHVTRVLRVFHRGETPADTIPLYAVLSVEESIGNV